jgi:hypothetical protein
MAAVVEAVSNAVESVGDAVGAVGSAISDVAQEVGNVVEDTAQSVGKTAEAIIQDPVKALPLVAVAVVAPQVAPLLWSGATTAQAAMLLNTGLQLAQGANPVDIAQNFAVNFATQGLVNELGLTTGTDFLDTGINKAISTTAQTGDLTKGLASGIVSGAVSAAKNLDFTEGPEQLGYDDEYLAEVANRGTDAVANSQVFQDAIEAGFTPDEARAIAQGQMDAETSGISPYAPTASLDGNVLVSAAPPEFENAEPIELAPEEEESPIDALATYGDFDMFTTDEAETPYLETEPTLGGLPTETEPSEIEAPVGGLPTETEPSEIEAPTDGNLPTEEDQYGMVSEQTDEGGLKTTTFDDGSTITTDADGNIIDFTESTEEEGDYGDYTDTYEETTDETSPSGFKLSSLAGPLSRASRYVRSIRGARRPTSRPTTSAPAGLDATIPEAGFLGSSLTPGISSGNPEFSIFGEVGQPQDQNVGLFATGGSTSQTQQGVYDLAGDISAPFTGTSKIIRLAPGVTKAKIDYALPGYPYGKVFKLAEGGNVSDHKPEFYSEGGLNSLDNRYVTGNGDGTSDSIPAMLANGEFVIPADVVSSLGNGSNDSGAKVLDEFLNVIRKHKRKADPKKLPPDSKGALGYLLEAKKKAKK